MNFWSFVDTFGISSVQIKQHKDLIVWIKYLCFPTKYWEELRVPDAKIRNVRLVWPARILFIAIFPSLPRRYYWLIEKNHMFLKQKCQHFGSLSPLARKHLWFFSSFWFSGRNKSPWTRPNHECYEHKYGQQTMWFINTILRRIVCFRPQNTNNFGSLAISIAFSCVSGFLVGIKKYICFWRKSKKIWLARSARSQPLMRFSRVSGKFMVGINRHKQDHITSVTNIRTHCTDKLCNSPTKYWEESHVSDTKRNGLLGIIYSFFSSFWSVCKTCFRRKSTNSSASSLRSLDIIYGFFSSFLFFTQYNEQDNIKRWIARFQRKIRNFGSLARNWYNWYMFSIRRKKDHAINYHRKNWWLPHRRPPTRSLIREISTEKITVSITPDDHFEGPYLLKTRELPGAPPPGPALALHSAMGPTAGPRIPPVWGARESPPPPFWEILDPPVTPAHFLSTSTTSSTVVRSTSLSATHSTAVTPPLESLDIFLQYGKTASFSACLESEWHNSHHSLSSPRHTDQNSKHANDHREWATGSAPAHPDQSSFPLTSWAHSP